MIQFSDCKVARRRRDGGVTKGQKVDYPVKWYRQRSIDRFIVDFFCYKAGLVVELDRSQHYTDEGIIYDSIRTDILEKYDLEVIRFSNIDVDKNFTGVCESIDRKVREKLKKQNNFNPAPQYSKTCPAVFLTSRSFAKKSVFLTKYVINVIITLFDYYILIKNS